VENKREVAKVLGGKRVEGDELVNVAGLVSHEAEAVIHLLVRVVRTGNGAMFASQVSNCASLWVCHDARWSLTALERVQMAEGAGAVSI
jgi:hypothetical protein